MNYSEMSDEEIDLAVQHARQGDSLWSPLQQYCNNPSDAWPIILSNKLRIQPAGEGGWFSDNLEDDANYNQSWHANPLRAAMIVYLMMKEGE